MNIYKRDPGPHVVEQHTATWHDTDRQRDVPIRIYLPSAATQPAPIVVFSHGLGGSRDTYSYLGRHWASHGYAALHLTHVGSDTEALRGPGGLPPKSLAEFLDDIPQRKNRPRDISFVLDQLAHESTLASRVDLNRIAVAGHSYGAYTAHALIGLVVDLPDQKNVSFTDRRIKAAIVMSPQSKDKFGLREDSWNGIDVPVLSLTGSKDIEYGIGIAAPRRTSYDRTPGRDQYLLIIENATHATFNDFPKLRIRVKPLNPAHHDYILMSTTAFLDTYLKHDATAQQWLLDDQLGELSGGACHLEYKHVTPIGNPR